MAEAAGEASPARHMETGIYTETLARLYLKQGFVEHALMMYRRVAQEQPENQALQARLRSLEQDIALGLLGQEATGQETVLPAPAYQEPGPGAASLIHTRVITRLERWLHSLQTRRLASGHSANTQHTEG